jgi:hypothetical protein
MKPLESRPNLFWLLLVSVMFLVIPVAFAAPPSQREQDLFDQISTRVSDHSAQWPKDVSDIVLSLDEGCWGMSFPCPGFGKIEAVTFWVCTRLAAWDANPKDHDETASYIWDDSPTTTIKGDLKIITYNNEIMIDATYFTWDDSSTVEKILNEGLVYHEFLHGQFGIDYLQSPASVNLACNCNTPDPAGHSDGGHDHIPGIQDNYIDSVGNLAGASTEVHRPEIEADPDSGTFTVDLGDKPNWNGVARVPDGGNVQNQSVSDPNNDGSIVVSGELIDPDKEGYVMVVVDPDSLYIYGFVDVDPAGMIRGQRRSPSLIGGP